MRFIDDPALVSEYGADVVAGLRAAVQPYGECAACDRKLGDATVRLIAQRQEQKALITVVHATCGTQQLADGVLFLREATWGSWAFGMPLTKTIEQRRGLLPPKQVEVPFTVAVLVINPGADVFMLTQHEDGWRDDARAMFDELGFAQLGQVDLGTTVRSQLDVSAAGGELAVRAGIDTFTLECTPQLRELIQTGGGLLVALTSIPFPGPGATSPVRQIVGDSAARFAWVPADQFTALTD